MNIIRLKNTDYLCLYMYQTEYHVPLEDVTECLSAGFTFLPKLVKAENTVYKNVPSKVDSRGYVI